MNKQRERVFLFLFISVLIVAAIAVGYSTKIKPNNNEKSFTMVITSERDDFDKKIKCSSSKTTLGEYVQTLDYCNWEKSEYGTYITGWYDMNQDLDNQYWWAVYVNGEKSPNGVDKIELKNGDEYEFILTKGW